MSSPSYTTTTLWSPAAKSLTGTLAVPFSSKATTVSTPSTITETLPVAPGMLMSTVALSPTLASLGTVILRASSVSNLFTVNEVAFSVAM